MYAILSHGGRQYRVSAGDRLLVDRLDVQIGSVIALEPVLLTGGDGATSLGDAVDGVRVAATVVAHPRGAKLRIFKYKAKKRYRRAAGHRSDLTEVRVESILSKGEDLPAATAAAPASRRATSRTVPSGSGRRTSRRPKAASTAAKPARTTKPRSTGASATVDRSAGTAPARAAKRAAPAKAAAKPAPSAKHAPPKTAAKRSATPTPTSSAKRSPKPASRARKADGGKDEEKNGGP